MLTGVDDFVRDEIELIIENPATEEEATHQKLTVLLETNGGFIETVERIVAIFRRHYAEVDFIIPNFAYSAGTVLALSGDNIYMDYYSVLGPIDPQFRTEGGESVPGMGYLSKYNELVELINAAQHPEAVRSELSFLLNKFDPAKLFHIEQAVHHSRDLIKEWLPKYKFKNWTHRSTSGLEVDDEYKKERADRIAEKLADASHWHSHGRGIAIQDLAAEDIGLKVENFGEDKELNPYIRHYYGLFSDYIRGMEIESASHTHMRMRRIG